MMKNSKNAYRRKNTIKENLTGYIFALPWLLGLLLLVAYPVIASLVYSFTNFRLNAASFIFTFNNYKSLFTLDPNFKFSVIDTVIFVLISIPLSMITSVAIALLLSKNVKGMKIYRTLFYLPNLVSIVATVMIWKWIYNPVYGPIAKIFSLFGRAGPDWLKDSAFAKSAIAIMGLWNVGGTVVIVLAALTDVPRSLFEAATLDGIGPFRRFFRITLPMISPVLQLNLIMAIIGGFQTFVPSLILTAGQYRTNFLGVMIYDKAFGDSKMIGYASAISWLLMLIIFVVTVIMVKLSKGAVFYADE